jgi:hypothetical protein
MAHENWTVLLAFLNVNDDSNIMKYANDLTGQLARVSEMVASPNI